MDSLGLAGRLVEDEKTRNQHVGTERWCWPQDAGRPGFAGMG